jgi:hypothetical protein
MIKKPVAGALASPGPVDRLESAVIPALIAAQRKISSLQIAYALTVVGLRRAPIWPSILQWPPLIAATRRQNGTFAPRRFPDIHGRN